MSHHHGGNNIIWILLFLMFPGVFIGWWILEALFYILVVLVYLIYTYFAPIFVVGIIIFIFYSLGKKSHKKITAAKSTDTLPKQPALPAVNDEQSAHVSHSYYSSHNESILVEDDEVRGLMEDHDIDEDTAEKAQELIDEGLDEEDAIELADEM